VILPRNKCVMNVSFSHSHCGALRTSGSEVCHSCARPNASSVPQAPCAKNSNSGHLLDGRGHVLLDIPFPHPPSLPSLPHFHYPSSTARYHISVLIPHRERHDVYIKAKFSFSLQRSKTHSVLETYNHGRPSTRAVSRRARFE
jgi:hypothetical protein